MNAPTLREQLDQSWPLTQESTMQPNPPPPRTFGQLAFDQGLALAASQGRLPGQVSIWDIAAADHADAVLAGLCEVTLDEYRRRVAAATLEFRRLGIPVVLVRATPRQILDTIAANNLPHTPVGQATAIGLLAIPVEWSARPLSPLDECPDCQAGVRRDTGQQCQTCSGTGRILPY